MIELETGMANLRRMFALADKTDMAEGLLAYQRYNEVMSVVADRFTIPVPRVIAAFVALSPNNDYMGNLRSLISVCHGWREGIAQEFITVSGYNHCRNRAWDYLRGTEFVSPERGLKTLNFYHNVLTPHDNRYVTIDGHMVAAWRDEQITMRQATITRTEYKLIADAVKALAFREFMLPNQYQAIVWFTRKRTRNVLFNPSPTLFDWARNDLWRTLADVNAIEPFPRARIAA